MQVNFIERSAFSDLPYKVLHSGAPLRSAHPNRGAKSPRSAAPLRDLWAAGGGKDQPDAAASAGKEHR